LGRSLEIDPPDSLGQGEKPRSDRRDSGNLAKGSFVTIIDITFPRPARWRAGANSPAVSLALSAALLLAFLIALMWSRSAVTTDTAQRCETHQGGFSSGFSSGFDVSRCDDAERLASWPAVTTDERRLLEMLAGSADGSTDDRRRDACFIDEDQPLQIKSWLLLLQGLTCGGDVRPVLLGGPQTFF
jgi:hypothetical protein